MFIPEYKTAKLHYDEDRERAIIILRSITQELGGRGIGSVILLEEHMLAQDIEIARLKQRLGGFHAQ